MTSRPSGLLLNENLRSLPSTSFNAAMMAPSESIWSSEERWFARLDQLVASSATLERPLASRPVLRPEVVGARQSSSSDDRDEN